MDKIDFTSIVLAFNSSKTIIETLESIKNQTFKPSQLIIRRDKSNEETVIKIEEVGLKDNSSLFSKVDLIKSRKKRAL